MPTYEYRCKECGEHLEVVQKFTDDALTECPACRGPLRKVFGNIGIVLKGSGFYKNDSRSGGSGKTQKADKSDKSDKSDKTETKSESTKTDSKSDSSSSTKSDSGSTSSAAAS